MVTYGYVRVASTNQNEDKQMISLCWISTYASFQHLTDMTIVMYFMTIY